MVEKGSLADLLHEKVGVVGVAIWSADLPYEQVEEVYEGVAVLVKVELKLTARSEPDEQVCSELGETARSEPDEQVCLELEKVCLEWVY